MRDPDAVVVRRAWVHCPRCTDHTSCQSCEAGHCCERHWRFLLESEGRYLFLQCPRCRYRWWHDTRFGVGGRLVGMADLPGFPPDEAQVA
ncbi:MAG: hypothetical protein JO100_18510 [Pseudonocardia sp.]|jgi:uncharacterized C2H2 Zn-finger protein|nr:hypothetical protein [Pseudonocardia sp.]